MKIIKAIPTNIITGSLGAGKTTVIKQLLKSKPANERWAVLVNEFGEIGIDGALLTGAFSQQMQKDSDNQTIFLREVPGGCMCCASGIPMQIALNQLIAQAKPHRLLIEPTGLGHPKELVQVLSSEYYKDVVKLESILCLIDARKTRDSKWRNHQTFQDQVEIADIIIATKSDLYAHEDATYLSQYLENTKAANIPVKPAINGAINTDILNQPSQASVRFYHTAGAVSNPFPTRPKQEVNPETNTQNKSDELTKAKNQGEGFYSCGWIWPAIHWFDYADILHRFNIIDVIRIKGIMITTEGIFGFNGQSNELEINEYDEALESRLEIIADSELALNQAADTIEKMQKAAQS